MSGGLGLASSGYGLQNAAFAPYNTALAGAASTEALGQNAFDLSSALGARQSTAGGNVAQILNQAANQAAGTQQTGMTAQNAAITGALAGGTDAVSALLRSWSGSGAGAGGGITSSAVYNPAIDIYSGGSIPLGYANF
jgi:flagellar hook-basal body complex protein FliE